MRQTAVAVLVLVAHLPGQIVTRGPALWEMTADSFLVAFTSGSDAVGAVEWGPTPAFGNTVTGPRARNHALRLTGLQPERFYFYQVRLDGRVATNTFRARTFPAAGSADLRFFVMADSGAGIPAQYRVADLIGRRSYRLGLLPGDIVYPDGHDDDFPWRFYLPYQYLLRRVPFYPVLGNHDVKTANGQPFLDNFYLPSSSSGTERYYSFDAGAVHFIGLDSNQIDATQTAWLRQDLAAARAGGARWIFAQLHHASYSSGNEHGRNQTVYTTWCPIFEEFEVDAVFSGHEHNYERSHVVREFFPNNRGVVYYVVGTGGQALYFLGQPQSYSAFSARKHGYLEVEICGNVMRTAFVDGTRGSLGQELDVSVRSRGPVTACLRPTSEHPSLGGTFTGAFDGPQGAPYGLFFAAQTGYLTLPPYGLYQLAIGNEVQLAAGQMPATETVPFQLPVPNSAALLGVDLLFQGVTLEAAVSVRLTNLLWSMVR